MVDQAPGDSESNMLSFSVANVSSRGLARLGQLVVPKRRTLETPTFMASSSRGIVPHLTQDEQAKDTPIPGMYMALEDFIEKAPLNTPPIFQIEPEPAANISRIRAFTGALDSTIIALGPRRSPPLVSPVANNSNSFAIRTSVGFRHETVESYLSTADVLEPDIFIGAADIPGLQKRGVKRCEKMADRTSNWTTQLLSARRTAREQVENIPALFAPLLPLEGKQQRLYIDELAADLPAGLAVYDPSVTQALPAALSALPRLSLAISLTPQAILSAVSAGIDLVVLQLVNIASDAGIALGFKFPAPRSQLESAVPLGRDMWDPKGELESSLEPLAPQCSCYACTAHHSAYVRHLLHANEMLGWTLLQVHNHAIVDAFFAGIREAIQRDVFEDEKEAFERHYVDDIPEAAGKGPRLRGYQVKPEGRSDAKMNPSAYHTLQVAEGSDTKTAEDVGGGDERTLSGGDEPLSGGGDERTPSGG